MCLPGPIPIHSHISCRLNQESRQTQAQLGSSLQQNNQTKEADDVMLLLRAMKLCALLLFLSLLVNAYQAVRYVVSVAVRV